MDSKGTTEAKWARIERAMYYFLMAARAAAPLRPSDCRAKSVRDLLEGGTAAGSEDTELGIMIIG
jgi:hypothetical protein